MKRMIPLFLLFCMMVLLAACGSDSAESSSDSEISDVSESGLQSETESKTKETDTSEEDGEGATDSGSTSSADSNILVAYFSCTGTTEQIARWIIGETGADGYEIVAEDPYTEEDLAYYTGGRADQEQADDFARPAIVGSVENIEQYDVIFLGYPIWHGQAPRIISTFLESCDFSDVTIIPFCTSHSSGIGSSAENLRSLCADTVTWMDGKRFSGDSSENDVIEWIDSLELKLIL
ncbi:MAG: flavodoxin [Clostridiales bacterium]|nr:flavodoxin [Clostridiales bacterium]